MMAICMVKGIRLQNPCPKYWTRFFTGVPSASPARNTMTSAISANTKASGNQRSLQSARAMPMRARRVSGAAAPLDAGGKGSDMALLLSGIPLRAWSIFTACEKRRVRAARNSSRSCVEAGGVLCRWCSGWAVRRSSRRRVICRTYRTRYLFDSAIQTLRIRIGAV